MRNKIILFIISFFFIAKPSFAQAPNWQWAKSSGGTYDECSNGVTTDSNGNVYVTGLFGSSAISFGSYTLTNAGNYDTYIVKYDASGSVLWAKQAGGAYDDVGYSVAADASGNVFLAGYYYSPTIVFGSYTLTNQGNGDIFIVKYDAMGNVLWAKNEGGPFDENCLGVAVDAVGNPIITGFFQSDTLVTGTYSLTNTGNCDVFLIKYDNSANTLWARSVSGAGDDRGTAISTDPSGNAFITGYFYSTAFSIGNHTLTTSGSNDFFVLKFDPSGNVIWAKSGGGTYNDIGYAIAADHSGNVCISGSFLSPTLTVGTLSCSNVGNFDIFIAKYDATGNELWVKGEGGAADEAGYGLTTDATGGVYVTGHFHSPSITIGNYTLSNIGVGDIYIAKYDGFGYLNWVKQAGGTSDEQGSCISSDASGNLYVAGYFYSSSINFDSNLVSTGGMSDMYLAKLQNVVTGNPLTQSGSKDIQLYPNPTNGEFNITESNFRILNVEIFNMNGCKVFDSVNSAGEKIKATGLATGIYIVKIRTESEVLTRKIIVE